MRLLIGLLCWMLATPIVLAAKPTGTPGITISAPTSAKAGDTITITVNVVNGATPNWAAVTTDRGVDVGDFAAQPFTMAWKVPAHLKGTVTFVAIAGDSAHDVGYTASATMQIGVVAPLQSLAIVGLDHYMGIGGPDRISMNFYQQTYPLQVQGVYADGVTRDIALGSTGTTYTSSNPASVQISADGEVQAIGEGNITVTATNSGLSASAPVTIDFTDPNYGLGLCGGGSNTNVNLVLTWSESVIADGQALPGGTLRCDGTVTLTKHANQISFPFHNNSGLRQLLVTPGIVVGSVSNNSVPGCAVSFADNLLPSDWPPYAVQDGTVTVTLPPKGGKCIVSLKITGQSDSVADKFTITNPAP